jgi:hypothetical protein
MHNAMREARDVRRHFGLEGEKMPDLPVFLPGILRRANRSNYGLGRGLL